MSNTNRVIDKFYQTKDGGKNWKRVTIDVPPSRHNSDHGFGGQGFYNMNVGVHPQNENIVFFKQREELGFIWFMFIFLSLLRH
jgi:hypothetical protein